MKLSTQLGLVRLASFSTTGLLATVDPQASVSELRVLRDSGVVAVVAPASAASADIAALGARLKEVPAPRKPRREGGGDMALVPSVKSSAADDEDGEEEEE